MEMGEKSKKLNNLVLSGLMIALTFLAGNIVKIPSIGGYIQLGDCMVFLSVVLLGEKRGALVGAIGMTLVDIYGGFFLWAPFTFIIKGAMGYIAGITLNQFKDKSIKSYIISFGLAGLFMIFAYFLSGTIIVFLLTEKINTFIGAMIYSSKDVIGNIVQVIVGIIIAIPLSKSLSKIPNLMHSH